jgi:hypothetical protein
VTLQSSGSATGHNAYGFIWFLVDNMTGFWPADIMGIANKKAAVIATAAF